jgi:hypothetical protein
MSRTGMVFGCLGLLLLCCLFFRTPTQAQDFPYAVPQAPEFDTGNSAPPPEPTISESRPRSRKHRRTQDLDYRSVRPYVQEPQAVPAARPYAPQPEIMEPPQQMANPTVASTPPPPRPMPQRMPMPQQPVQGSQRPPDCSQFPVLIAQSKSESEMQMTARMYLTCLLKSGWQMEQAKQQVIATIETTYRLPR